MPATLAASILFVLGMSAALRYRHKRFIVRALRGHRDAVAPQYRWIYDNALDRLTLHRQFMDFVVPPSAITDWIHW